VAAASNYLNFLATGEENENWVILPPQDSSNWSWDDYFELNAKAHREQWKRWYKGHVQR
jgi:hypothetical protein